MKAAQIVVFSALGGILGIPFLLRPAGERGGEGEGGDTLVVVTPHVQQLRAEFGAGFDRWHLRKTGRHARVDWRTPGGTTEIVKQLEAEYTAALKSGIIKADGSCEAGAAGTDLALGGG